MGIGIVGTALFVVSLVGVLALLANRDLANDYINEFFYCFEAGCG